MKKMAIMAKTFKMLKTILVCNTMRTIAGGITAPDAFFLS